MEKFLKIWALAFLVLVSVITTLASSVFVVYLCFYEGESVPTITDLDVQYLQLMTLTSFILSFGYARLITEDEDDDEDDDYSYY